MNYIDLAIGTSIFLFFFVLVLVFSTNYFSNLSGLTKISEFRTVSKNLFEIFFEGKGVPEDWDENLIIPVQLGLVDDLYAVPILVEETSNSSRVNEPFSLHVTFDENCQNKTWNTTIRMYDENNNELNIRISNVTFCIEQFLKEGDIAWEINVSANKTKNYYLYYSSDKNIASPNYPPLIYNTTSWIPSDGDIWTETTTDWSSYSGSEEVINDTIIKKRGNSSVSLTGNFSSNSCGLRFDPSNNINGISNEWYVDVWLYIDNKTNLSIYFYITDANLAQIYINLTDNISSSTWYHLVKKLDPTSGWETNGQFNASTGIDQITFHADNSSVILERTFKVDGLHFKKKPLIVKTFPEEKISVISYKKLNALGNMSYENVRKTIGENYKFRIEVNEYSFGEIKSGANVGCFETPKIIQYQNGSIENVVPKVCVWK